MSIFDLAIDFKVAVTIEIGEDSKEYVVHRDLVCHYSSYFRAAFKDKFIEGQEGRLRISDYNGVVFDNFVRWLYSQTLPDWDEEEQEQREQAHDLCELYVFADYVSVPALKKLIIDKYVSWMTTPEAEGCFLTTTDFVYLHTIESSPLRRLIVDDWCLTFNFSAENIDEVKERPVEFVADLLLRREVTKGNSVIMAEDYYDEEVKASLTVVPNEREEKE